MRFKELFNINEQIESEDFSDKIKNIMLKYFPNSYANAKYSKGFKDSIYGVFTLGKDKSEYQNGIHNNDPLIHTFHIWFKQNDKYDLEWSQGSMTVKPDKPYMAYGRVKTGIRDKNNASSDEILKTLDNFFKKLPSIIKTNADKIHHDDIELFKKKNLI